MYEKLEIICVECDEQFVIVYGQNEEEKITPSFCPFCSGLLEHSRDSEEE